VTTARTLTRAAEALKEMGAREVYAGATHGVLVPGAAERIRNSPIRELVISDTVPLTAEATGPKFKVLSVAPLLAEAIRRIHDERSLSTLFI